MTETFRSLFIAGSVITGTGAATAATTITAAVAAGTTFTAMFMTFPFGIWAVDCKAGTALGVIDEIDCCFA